MKPRQKKGKAKAVGQLKVEARPVSLGGHTLDKFGSTYGCTVCDAWSKK